MLRVVVLGECCDNVSDYLARLCEIKRAQRKIPVDLHFIVRLRHKASGAALGLSCAVCFEQPAGVFDGCGAVCQAKFQTTWLVINDR